MSDNADTKKRTRLNKLQKKLRRETGRAIADFNMIASIGGFLFGFSQLLFLYIVIKCIKGGEKAEAKPWEGAEGLEWEVASPAPYHTFSTPPEVK